MLGMTLVRTSPISPSNSDVVLRIVMYMASSTPACSRTAMPVRAMNNVSLLSITVPPLLPPCARGGNNRRVNFKKTRLRDSYRSPYRRSLRDMPDVQLHKQPGTDLSVGSRLHGLDRPRRSPVRGLRVHDS